MWILGYLIVGAGIVLTAVGATLGLWKAAEGARIGSRSTHQVEEAVFDETMDIEELQGDYVRGMGAQAAGLTEVAITMQAAVAPDVSLATPGLSEGITFGSLAGERYEDRQQDYDATDSDDDTADDGADQAQDAPVVFAGTITVDLSGANGNQGQGTMAITVTPDGSVTGSLRNTYEEAYPDGGMWYVTQTGTFAGSIDASNAIVATGSFRTVATDDDGASQTKDLPLAVRATPTEPGLGTWSVVAGPQGGEMTTFTGHAE